MTTNLQTFIQGQPNNTTVTSTILSAMGSTMLLAKGAGATVVTDTSFIPQQQGGTGEVLLFTNASGTGTHASYTGLSETVMAVKCGIRAPAAMPGNLVRLVDIRNASGTACRIQLSAANQLFVQNQTGTTIFTGPTLTATNEYRLELAISVSVGSATIHFGAYPGNDASALVGGTYSTTTGNTGSANITEVDFISYAAATGVWQMQYFAFAAKSQSTLIGPVPVPFLNAPAAGAAGGFGTPGRLQIGYSNLAGESGAAGKFGSLSTGTPPTTFTAIPLGAGSTAVYGSLNFTAPGVPVTLAGPAAGPAGGAANPGRLLFTLPDTGYNLFTPPTVFDQPTTLATGHRMNRLASFYRPMERGQSVWVTTSGEYTLQQPVFWELVDHVFLGGHEYNVSDDEADTLEANGFIVQRGVKGAFV